MQLHLATLHPAASRLSRRACSIGGPHGGGHGFAIMKRLTKSPSGGAGQFGLVIMNCRVKAAGVVGWPTKCEWLRGTQEPYTQNRPVARLSLLRPVRWRVRRSLQPEYGDIGFSYSFHHLIGPRRHFAAQQGRYRFWQLPTTVLLAKGAGPPPESRCGKWGLKNERSLGAALPPSRHA